MYSVMFRYLLTLRVRASLLIGNQLFAIWMRQYDFVTRGYSRKIVGSHDPSLYISPVPNSYESMKKNLLEFYEDKCILGG
jgi:hypothetical protein